MPIQKGYTSQAKESITDCGFVRHCGTPVTPPPTDPVFDKVYIAARRNAGSPNENSVYVVDRDDPTVPWSNTSTPWLSETVLIVGGGNPSDAYSCIRVDQDGGYIFTSRNGNLWRHDIDGTNGSIINTTGFIEQFDINTDTERLCFTNNGAIVYECDYSGTQTNSWAAGGSGQCSGPAYDQSGTYIYFVQRAVTVAPDRVKRITLSGGAVTDMFGTPGTRASNLGLIQQQVDEDQSTVFLLDLDATSWELRSYSYPSDTSTTTLVTVGVVGFGIGMFIDKTDQRAYVSNGSAINRYNYSGTLIDQVVNWNNTDFATRIDIGTR